MEAAVFCPADLEPEKLDRDRRLRSDDLRGRGQLRRLQPADGRALVRAAWAFVNVGLRSYYAEGSKTLAYEIAEQLGWELPDVVVAPIASGSLFTKVAPGLRRAARARPGRRAGRRASSAARRTAARPSPPRSPTARRCAGPAGDGRPLARDRQLRRRRPRGRDRPRDRRRDPRRRRGGGRREHGAPRARRPGSSARPPRASPSARCATAVAAGQVGPDDRVVLLVTGDGLKTPGPVADAAPAGRDRGRRRRAPRPARRRHEQQQASLSVVSFTL